MSASGMKVSTVRVSWGLLAAGAAGLAAASLLLTLWLDLNPCHLCIFQRLLFMILTVLCGLMVWRPASPVVALFVALSAGTGVGVAGYQSWLQAQPPGSVSCLAGQPGPIERLVEWLGAQSPELFLATGFCEDAELVVLGFSLANWALLTFTAYFVFSLWNLFSIFRRGRRETLPT